MRQQTVGPFHSSQFSPLHFMHNLQNFFFEGFYQHANTSIETTKSFSTLQPVHQLKGGTSIQSKGFQLCHFRSRSYSIIFIVYTWTPNITPLTKDHQVWSSISKHMTPNYYSSSSQSILGDLTNNMSFSVSPGNSSAKTDISVSDLNSAAATEQKVSAFAPLLPSSGLLSNNHSAATQSAFWTAYQKSLQDLQQQQKPISFTSNPLDLTSSKW